MEGKHSPRPWSLIGCPTLGYSIVSDSGGHKSDSLALVKSMSQETTECNARLIAAAPDLLAALNAAHSILIQFVDYQRSEWCAKIAAAIAKATGE